MLLASPRGENATVADTVLLLLLLLLLCVLIAEKTRHHHGTREETQASDDVRTIERRLCPLLPRRLKQRRRSVRATRHRGVPSHARVFAKKRGCLMLNGTSKEKKKRFKSLERDPRTPHSRALSVSYRALSDTFTRTSR